jgi:hypothetical protein
MKRYDRAVRKCAKQRLTGDDAPKTSSQTGIFSERISPFMRLLICRNGGYSRENERRYARVSAESIL